MSRPRPILLAEDEETDVLLFRMALQKSGLATPVIHARDGQEVVRYLSSSQPNSAQPAADLPGLLLLDLKMPVMNGFEVLQWLAVQPSFKDLPIVIFSSSAHDSDVEKANALGAREYIVKPHDIQGLVQVVQLLHQRYLPTPVSEV